jgi:hypothetical protein
MTRFRKSAYLTLLFLTVQSMIFSQTGLFKGVVIDEKTLMPVADVNIKVYGTTTGTSTDAAGKFSLKVEKIPATILFTCIGYEGAAYPIAGTPKTPIEFQLRPKTYLLEEVGISSNRYDYLFKDKDYSVLDYEIMGDNLVLLIFKNQVKESELLLLARNGDTLLFSPLPEGPPAKLFKDFLSNVHYISKDEQAFQFLYNEQKSRLEFFHGITVDSLQTILMKGVFKLWGRIYFQEKIVSGFGTAFGFYEKGVGKRYIRTYVNERKLSKLGDDQSFYNSWNMYRIMSDNTPKSLLPREDEFYTTPEFDFGTGEPRGWTVDKNETRAHQLEFYKMIFPVVKTPDDNIAFFNFATDSIELMNGNGKRINGVPIKFHTKAKDNADSKRTIKLSDSDWRWGSRILTDEYSREVYTIFLKNGMVKIQRVDLETGALAIGTVLPFPFPEKIEIYKGDAYFLIKNDGSNDNWKLLRCKL